MKNKSLQTVFSDRQYMISRDYELYYYHDREIKKVNDHRHDYYEFYFFMEGDVSICIEGTEHPLHVGDVVIIPPGVSHHAVIRSTKNSYSRFVLWLSSDFYAEITQQADVYRYLLHHVEVTGSFILPCGMTLFNSLQTQLFDLVDELHAERYGRESMIMNRISILLLTLSRTMYETDHPKAEAPGRTLVSQVIDYIDANLTEDLSLDALSARFFVSKYHLSHLFSENIGIPIGRYITRKRLQAGREAIGGGGQIREIASQYGFTDYSSFYRAFVKEFGLAPGEYRSQCKNHLASSGKT